MRVPQFMNPEEKARQQIDALLWQGGWTIQNYKTLDLSVGRGIALREVPLKGGTCDYLLLVDRKAVGIVEAKPEGTTLSGVADQSAYYGDNLPDIFQTVGRLPFLYESTGVETFFRDERDPHPRSRRVFAFHRPETLAEWMKHESTLRFRLAQMSFAHPLAKAGMRDCQIEAITQLEQSFANAHPRALIQMATGAGKTFTACAFIYRLIRFAGAKRVLFLVDRANLGRQATGEFHSFVTPDTGRKFTELYNVQHLQSNKLDDVSRVTICTIQRLYSMLRGEELPEGADELSTYEIGAALTSGSGVPPLDLPGMRQDAASTSGGGSNVSPLNSSSSNKRQDAASTRPLEVSYNPNIPIEAFDFIVTDECHRSIYNLWRQVLEYFDSFLIGLTATPSKQTIGFFNGNLVTEYNHERAVADGVNVGYEVYRIKTDVTERGGKVEKGFYIDRRCKETRKRRWEQLDDDLEYSAKELDRSVVVPDQIRTVVKAFKSALETELFPGRQMVPKTLIFAKDDSHAEDIVHIVREVFGKGNDFCKKITYQSKNAETGKAAKGEELIQQFRTSPQLRIAVTVDMIATGTDIKPLECLLFLRDVRSRVYFEQMKGRGTRVLTPTDLQAVSGEDARAKTHFVIVDAVGVCESDKTDSRPLERKPGVALDKLLLGVALGKRDEDTLTTLAGRLARLDRALSSEQQKQLQAVAGQPVAELASTLLRAVDPDEIEAEVEAASRRLLEQNEQKRREELGNYFSELAPVEFLTGNLPHWRQEGVTYFVTFRLADSLPAEKLAQWRQEREAWLQQQKMDAVSGSGVPPLDGVMRQDAASIEYQKLFSTRIETWLDQGSGSCVLDIPECRAIVENALRFFDGERYALGEFVVAPNHVHVIVAPKPGHHLSNILHSWKSFTAKEILKVEAASRRLEEYSVEAASRRLNHSQSSGKMPLPPRQVWQKEYFDHIIRNADLLARIEQYIRAHKMEEPSQLLNLEELRRDAAANLVNAACAPFDKPALREALVKARRESEQTLDVVTQDKVLAQGFDAAAKERAQNLIGTFKAYIEEHREEIAALQILYSRPYRQRLSEGMLKELESKLRETNATWHEETLWNAFALAAPERVTGKTQVNRFADLVPIVRFALEQQPVLEPFARSVRARFESWLEQKAAQGTHFTDEQRAWLELIADHIATSLSIEPDDFDYAPFSQQGGLGKAAQLFGSTLTPLLDELNEVLAA